LETYFLVDYLRSKPAHISVWKQADKMKLKKDFSPWRIRGELDKRDGYTGGQRKAIYDLISEHASHATYRGFHLTTQYVLAVVSVVFSYGIDRGFPPSNDCRFPWTGHPGHGRSLFAGCGLKGRNAKGG
jgi:hypothetical protein